MEPTGWAVLHGLRETIEQLYSGWFIPHLATAWAKVVEGSDGQLKTWTVPEVTSQQAFFEREVLPLYQGGVKRVFVVISDALRLEVAHELVQLTNSKNGFKARLGAMLGVFIVNSLNGSTVLVTADHGFMYQESALDGADKSSLDEKPAGTVKAKKRYLIGRNLGTSPKAWSGNTATTAGTTPEGSMDFWVPKGASRFHFAGGARFVHGSAMPQEVVVPLITVRTAEAGVAKTRPVSISLLGIVNKIVTSSQRFEFIQTDAVTSRPSSR